MLSDLFYRYRGGTRLLQDLFQDLKYGLRMLAKNPGLTFVIVLSLAIGIGANTAVFSVTSTLLLKPLPYPHPDRLAILWLRSPGIGIPQDWPSPGQYHDIKTQNHVFDETALAIGQSYTLSGLSKAIKVDGISASSSLLPMLGVKPLLGRVFLPEEDRPAKNETVVLTYGLWKQAFGGDSNILGRTITLDGRPHTVVGVLPANFQLNHEVVPTVGGIDKPDVFLPLPLDAKDDVNYGPENYNILARLKPGVTMQQAQADISIIAARLREEKHRDRSFTISVVPLMEQVVGNARSAVLILLGAVALVLLIACTNVANLLLSRAAGRQKEIAMRTALGASQARLVMQLLTESVLLSVLGGAAGLLVSACSLYVVQRMHPGNIPRLDEIGMDFRVLTFTLAISILTGIVFGLAPALRASRVDLNSNLKAGGSSSNSGGLNVKRDKLRGALVIAEIAVSLTLLTGAGLLVRSFVRLINVPPGFNPEGVISMHVAASGPKYEQKAQRFQFYQELGSGCRESAGSHESGCGFGAPAHSLGGMGRNADRGLRAAAEPARVASRHAHRHAGLFPDNGDSVAPRPALFRDGHRQVAAGRARRQKDGRAILAAWRRGGKAHPPKRQGALAHDRRRGGNRQAIRPRYRHAHGRLLPALAASRRHDVRGRSHHRRSGQRWRTPSFNRFAPSIPMCRYTTSPPCSSGFTIPSLGSGSP